MLQDSKRRELAGRRPTKNIFYTGCGEASVDNAEGNSVGNIVGEAVGASVGSTDDGGKVITTVGRNDGTAVCNIVGARVGGIDGTAVGI